MRSVRIGGALIIASVALAAGIALAAGALSPGQDPSRPEDVRGDPVDRGIRKRTQPGTWKRGAVGKFKTVLDRDAARSRSIADRATRRAFDGAPPVMPHSAVFGEGTKVCLDCHSEGMKLGNRVAHPMSHPPLSTCVQCHVEASNRQFQPLEDPATSFVGMESAGAGPRWTAVAPPQIPHDVTMRTHCLSCHGEFGYPGIRTEHPERANCVQCHVTTEMKR